jgi:hypothetical protein
MAEALPRTPTRLSAPTLADVLVQQPRAKGLEYLTPYEVDTEAWRLSVLGWSSWRIKAALGLADLTAVSECLTRYRESDILTDDLKVGIMVAQLDDAIERVIMVLHAEHFKFHKGDVIRMEPEGGGEPVPVIDDGPVLDASKTLTVLLDRKIRLLGLDAPEKHEHNHTVVPLPQPAQAWLDERRRTIEGTST